MHIMATEERHYHETIIRELRSELTGRFNPIAILVDIHHKSIRLRDRQKIKQDCKFDSEISASSNLLDILFRCPIGAFIEFTKALCTHGREDLAQEIYQQVPDQFKSEFSFVFLPIQDPPSMNRLSDSSNLEETPLSEMIQEQSEELIKVLQDNADYSTVVKKLQRRHYNKVKDFKCFTKLLEELETRGWTIKKLVGEIVMNLDQQLRNQILSILKYPIPSAGLPIQSEADPHSELSSKPPGLQGKLYIWLFIFVLISIITGITGIICIIQNENKTDEQNSHQARHNDEHKISSVRLTEPSPQVVNVTLSPSPDEGESDDSPDEDDINSDNPILQLAGDMFIGIIKDNKSKRVINKLAENLVDIIEDDKHGIKQLAVDVFRIFIDDDKKYDIDE